MFEIDLGSIEDVIGFDDYIEKILAEKQKIIDEQQSTISRLEKENEQLKELATRTEEEKEHYADLYNKCHRHKFSDEAIKQAYADLNRREREKHSQGNATYTAKINQNEVIY